MNTALIAEYEGEWEGWEIQQDFFFFYFIKAITKLSALFVLNQFTKGLWVSIHFFSCSPAMYCLVSVELHLTGNAINRKKIIDRAKRLKIRPQSKTIRCDVRILTNETTTNVGLTEDRGRFRGN
jgi:hypothetical protein